MQKYPSFKKYQSRIDPPWVALEDEQELRVRTRSLTGPAYLMAQRFSNFLDAIPRKNVLIYSDGLKLSNRNIGDGYVIF